MDALNEEPVKIVVGKLLRLLNKFARVEKLPIRIDGGIELTTKEVHTIQAIGEHKKINVTEVGAHFGVTKGAASQMVSRLVERGFVDKAVSAHSNKEFELTLTDLGWRAFRAHERFHGKDMDELVRQLQSFSPEQLQDVSSVLRLFETVMDKRLKE